MSKRRGKKKLNFLDYVNPKTMRTEVHRFGYNFSMKNYLRNLILVMAAVIALAYFYQLKVAAIAVILVVVMIFMPSLVITAYKDMYEQKKFDDLTHYMEQMLQSFKRRNKILTSLRDTLTIFPEGEMHDDIVAAINYIEKGVTLKGDVYKEAFYFIERDFGCKRLYTIHDFLIRIENTGGVFDQSVNILLNDRKLWVERVYALQIEKKNIKVKVAIGVLLSFIVGLVAVYVIPEELEVVSKLVSQIVTTGMFICNLAIWYFTNQVLSGSLISNAKEYSDEELARKYDIAFYKDMTKEKRIFTGIGILMIPVVVLMYFKSGFGVAAILAFLVFIIATHPERLKKSAIKRIRTEVEKVFPDWLMSMSLLLQTENVHVALSKSIGEAAPILQPELRKLQRGIETRPNAVEPYIDFMRGLDIPDVQSAMKMLFALNEFGSKDVSEQIGTLVDRNFAMTDRAERLRNEDFLAGTGFFVLAPMITGVSKLVTDMALIIFSMLSIVNTF